MRYFSLYNSLIFLLFLIPSELKAQETIVKKPMQKQSKIIQKAESLSDALDKNDELKIAKNYEELANQFLKKGNQVKAEEYLNKALTSFTKLNSNEDKVRVIRSLAKLQESQKKYEQASSNYKEASSQAKDLKSEKLNENDFKRLNKNTNSLEKVDYLNSNIKILKEAENKEELSDVYIQKAEENLLSNDIDNTIENYKQAIVFSKNNPNKVIEIKNKIAKVYASNNEFDKALEINETLLIEAEKKNDFETQIKQKQLLATIYFDKNETDKALKSLNEAYKLASKKGNTAEVKNSLIALVTYYQKNGKSEESNLLYKDFIENFDSIIQSDTSLINTKTFQISEQKIRQLEKEKTLKDELISKKNSFNYVLIGAVFLMLIFFILIAKALFSIKKKNKKIALQSLRREMNPHFIFNSLNSVNQFISENNELEANKYLTNYSNLMRNIMENSNNDFVTLSNELELLKKYLELEHQRFHEKFDFKISVDEKLDTDSVFIPNMIIQPHLENAIWHGLRYKNEKGFLSLHFQLAENKIVAFIDDNGIGLSKSNELKTHNQKVHQSRGLTNTKERIALLNDLFNLEVSFKIKEKEAPESGTIVEIYFPYINKKL